MLQHVLYLSQLVFKLLSVVLLGLDFLLKSEVNAALTLDFPFFALFLSIFHELNDVRAHEEELGLVQGHFQLLEVLVYGFQCFQSGTLLLDQTVQLGLYGFLQFYAVRDFFQGSICFFINFLH